MYDKYITENHLNIYGKTLIKLPTPRYTVLYNGMDEQPAFMQLRLSDFLSIQILAEVKDVCITEYNEKTFVDGIRAEGRAEGREEGQNLLATVVQRLRKGETPEQIQASGVDYKTIELAQTIK